MTGKSKRKSPAIILKDGKPSAVILDIDVYRKILESLADREDLKILEAMRKKPLKFRKLEDFLKEYQPGV
ncbi:MAG: type II toxin-antitoxin system Phd/YefM family antitoxin [candidate division WOR-3 bacterium]